MPIEYLKQHGCLITCLVACHQQLEECFDTISGDSFTLIIGAIIIPKHCFLPAHYFHHFVLTLFTLANARRIQVTTSFKSFLKDFKQTWHSLRYFRIALELLKRLYYQIKANIVDLRQQSSVQTLISFLYLTSLIKPSSLFDNDSISSLYMRSTTSTA